MNLRDTTSHLLTVPDVGTWIRLADNYIQTYNRMPEKFVLPAEHSILLPIVESFATDTNAFADYIRALRDASTGFAYDDLHALYRTISVRALQVVRRTRLRKAVMLLLPTIEATLGRSISYDEQLFTAKFMEQAWGAERINLMNRERSSTGVKRLTTDDRSVLLDAFWTNIDKKLDAGDVVMGDASLGHLIHQLETK